MIFFFFSNLRQNIFLRRKVLITSINVENGHAIEITSCLAIDTMFILLLPQEAAIYRCFIEKPYRRKLSYFTEKYLRWRPALVKLLAYDSKQAPSVMFSCKLCKVFQNSFFMECLPLTASKLYKTHKKIGPCQVFHPLSANFTKW